MIADVTTIDEIVDAYRGIEAAERHYRELLRAGIAEKINQTELARRLDRSREKIRQDAMSDEDRDQIRAANRSAKAARRNA